MTENKTHEGGCQCGRIRYKLSGAPNNTTNCHCIQCRMAAGGPYITWTDIPAEQVTFSGEKLRLYKSSDIAERGFCPACGTALTFRFLEGDGLDIATATLDDPGVFPPQQHIWTDSKIAWLAIDDGLPQYPRGRGNS